MEGYMFREENNTELGEQYNYEEYRVLETHCETGNTA